MCRHFKVYNSLAIPSLLYAYETHTLKWRYIR